MTMKNIIDNNTIIERNADRLAAIYRRLTAIQQELKNVVTSEDLAPLSDEAHELGREAKLLIDANRKLKSERSRFFAPAA